MELDGGEGDHTMEGTPGIEIVKDLKRGPNDYFIKKSRYNVFLGTSMEYLLNGLGIKPGDTLILFGVDTDVCVHYPTVSAHQSDYHVRVVAECCAGTSSDANNAALTAIEQLETGAGVKLEDMLSTIAKYKTQKQY